MQYVSAWRIACWLPPKSLTKCEKNLATKENIGHHHGRGFDVFQCALEGNSNRGSGGRDENRFSHVLILTKASIAVQFPTTSKMIGLTSNSASLSRYRLVNWATGLQGQRKGKSVNERGNNFEHKKSHQK
jgi:hypothetical protein